MSNVTCVVVTQFITENVLYTWKSSPMKIFVDGLYFVLPMRYLIRSSELFTFSPMTCLSKIDYSIDIFPFSYSAPITLAR